MRMVQQHKRKKCKMKKGDKILNKNREKKLGKNVTKETKGQKDTE